MLSDHFLLFFYHVESPLHIGTGMAVGTVDLPIVREKPSNHPFIPASSIKGVLRDGASRWEKLHRDKPRNVQAKKVVNAVFGPTLSDSRDGDRDSGGGTLRPGAATFQDGRLLLLPVSSPDRHIVWLTCPWVLERFARDLRVAGDPKRATVAEAAALAGGGGAALATGTSKKETLYLRDGMVEATPLPKVEAFAKDLAGWIGLDEGSALRRRMSEDLAVVPDELFGALSWSAMEVVARVRMRDGEKVVDRGGLWTEELVPCESVFYSTVACNSASKDILELSADAVQTFLLGAEAPAVEGANVPELSCFSFDRMQMGGDATIGRGIVRIRRLRGGIS